MNGIEKESIFQTLKDAQNQLIKLEQQKETIKNYIKQIENSASQTISDVDSVFDSIKQKFCKILDDKRSELNNKALIIKKESVRPLEQCKNVIENEIVKVENFITSGEKLLKKNIITNERVVKSEMFIEESSKLGNIPAVPTVQEVPFITFQYDLNNLLIKFDDRINNIGFISKIGPVQIIQFIAKPGGCLLEWSEVETDEKFLDIQMYQLQRAYGNVIVNHELEANFKDCYLGNNLQYLSKNMNENVEYTFRLRCLVENNRIWSAWSRPFVASTNMAPFMWNSINGNYQITNENKIATKISSKPSVIYSQTAQFYPDCAIEFTFLECGESSEEECIGIVDNIENPGLSLIRAGTFVLSSTGQLFINGEEKLTLLPKFQTNSKVIFLSQIQTSDKLRINVEHQNKIVTYDWNVQNADRPLYFAANFSSKSWKVLVE